MPGEGGPIKLTALGRAGAVLALALMVAIVVLLVLVVVSTRQLQSGIHHTDQRIGTLRTELRPLAHQGPNLLHHTTGLLADTSGTVDDVAGAVPPIRRAVEALAANLVPLAQALPPGEASATLAAVRSLASTVDATLGEVHSLGLLRRASGALATVPRLGRDVGALRAGLGTSLAIQRKLLRHVASLDEKLGGQVPALSRRPGSAP